jgi:predicted enzyme related to lactoylglutathione lyase
VTRHDALVSRRRVHSITPLFVVRDVERSAAFYCDVLGFEDPSFFAPEGGPAEFCMINRDGHELMLKRSRGEGDVTPNGRPDAWDVYLRVADVAAEKEGIERAGGTVVAGPRDTFYSMREIEVLDPDGYRTCLAQDVS